MNGFTGDLEVKLITDDQSGLWELMAPLSFTSVIAGRTITAPAGHRTDFCSVPRVPLAYDMLSNRARKAGTLHDLLYVTHELPRELADQVLREMLLQDGVGDFEAQEFFAAVRMFGGSHWGPEPGAQKPT
jgi:hypothetical protein